MNWRALSTKWDKMYAKCFSPSHTMLYMYSIVYYRYQLYISTYLHIQKYVSIYLRRGLKYTCMIGFIILHFCYHNATKVFSLSSLLVQRVWKTYEDKYVTCNLELPYPTNPKFIRTYRVHMYKWKNNFCFFFATEFWDG